MTDALTGRLLGGPTFFWGDLEVRPASRKGVALLTYLAAEGCCVTRDVVAELFWSAGRLGSVRQALYELRQLPGARSWLRLEDTRVRLEARTDIATFERLCAHGEHARALELWNGPLADDLEDPGAPAFREWLHLERARLDMRRADALQCRVVALEQEGLFEQALACVEELLESDPLNESAYRAGMRLHYVSGRATEALALFDRCRSVLWHELGASPLPVTLELADAIGRGKELPVCAAASSLPVGLKRVVQALVVGRGDLPPTLLAEVLEREPLEVAEDLAKLQHRRLVDSHHAVPQAMLPEATAITPGPVARVLHRRIAKALEAAGAPGTRVARHWLGAFEPSRAAPRLLRAAHASASRGDVVSAERRAYRALWASDDAGVRLEASLLLAGVARTQGNGALEEAALAFAEQQAAEAEGARRLVEVRLLRVDACWRRGRTSEAATLARSAVTEAAGVDDAELVARAEAAVEAASAEAGGCARLPPAQAWDGEAETLT